ncbi:efflux RND transporter permease subunit [Agrobacterium sp. a22-2]|uniref:efflux RND transporter permease subunit n=1 Tax=Agrobacterium sp. a22-2 TaxID=2283840 RepID=UPI001445E16E|nr:efflux RND transporter permease subunit [Agrobacterium sp. a22-2]NKN38972.1 efflux RND transporter permease subunit [Agrobacterium sp. a22-2]
MFLTRMSIGNPVFATMMMVVLLVFGAFAYDRLGVDQFPNVDVPVVVVTTTYPGATPEAVEVDVTKTIEAALNTISGIDEVTSTSYDGRSVVVASFKLEVKSPVAAQDVRDKVAALDAELPDEVEKPVVSRFNPFDEPIISIAVTSATLGVPELTNLVQKRVIRELATVSGVGQATLVGGQKQQIDIRVDETRLSAFGVGVDEVIEAIKTSNRNRPAGSVITGLSERSIQIQGRVSEPKELLDLVVARRGGAPVYLSNVASVKIGPADPESRALYNGETALAIDLVKIQDANTVQVVRDVRKRLDQLENVLASKDARLEIIKDASKPIVESLSEVQSALIEGAALAVAIVFLFLNSWRSTVITALTLPISMIGTLAIIDFLGFTLNMLSLLALTLSIGILVDDAIVVRENITRHLHMGKSHFQAALDGTAEIGLAVMATTAAIVAVFLPVAFMEGMVGRFFYEFGVTVSAAVVISLFVAFTLDPMLSSIWHDPDAEPDAVRGPIGRTIARFDRGFELLVTIYRKMIRWMLRYRLVTLMFATAVFVASIFMVPLVGVEFVATSDEGQFQINVSAPAGSSLDYTTAKLRQVEAALREFPEVASTYSTINTGGNPGKHNAALLVSLVPHHERERTPVALADPIRQRLSQIPGIKIAFIQSGLGGGASPIQLSLLGDDRAVLEKAAAELISDMRQIPGVVDINSSSSDTKLVFSVRLKPEQAGDLDVGVDDISAALAPFVSGEEVGTWSDSLGETHDLVVRLPENQRDTVSAIRDLMIKLPNAALNGESAQMVRLNQVADIELVPSASEIRRLNQSREILISADVSGRAMGDVTADLEAIITEQKLPAGYRIKFGGDAEDIGTAAASLIKALIMAVIFIYVVLASQFGSFLQPLAIMAALPLSLVGVLLGLLVAGSTINMFSMIGFIMLMGLVTKNGILLVDFANRERQRGLSVPEALANAGAVRFRPIVMTTLAMICGMIPLALVTSGAGAQRAPMAHAVIGGLLSSTILTLIVVPVIISCIASLARKLNGQPLLEAPQDHSQVAR